MRARLKQFTVMNKLKKRALKVMPQIFLFDNMSNPVHLLWMFYCDMNESSVTNVFIFHVFLNLLEF